MTYYHVAPAKIRDSIQREGLRSEDWQQPPYVWLFDDLERARQLQNHSARWRPHDIWEVQPPGEVQVDPHPGTAITWGHSWVHNGPITSDHLKLLDDGQHVANILDPIHATLDVRVFDNPAAPEPQLKPHLQQWIPQTIFEALDRHGYDHPDTWLTLALTGSLTTYQYSDSSDCDVSLFVDATKLPDWSRAEMIGIMVSEFDNVKLPGTPFPLQAFVVAPGLQPQDLYKPGLRSAYVVYGQQAGSWLVPPDRERIHDVEHEMDGAYTAGLLACDKLDLLLRYEPDHAIEFWHELHKKRMRDQSAGQGDYSTSNIEFKMLVNRGLAQQAAKLAGEHLASS